MKKFFLYILIVVLFLSIYGCNTNTTNDSDISDDSSRDPSTMDSTPSEQVDYDLIICKTMAEYNRFIEECSALPDDFLRYNDINYLGEFHRFTYLSNTKMNDYSHYLYTLVDCNDYELMVYVHEGPNKAYPEREEIADIAATDMRYLGSEKNAVYYQGKIGYRYSGGKLNSIYWMQNGWEISISGTNGMLDQYPHKETSVMARLLNQSLASATYTTYIAPSIK